MSDAVSVVLLAAASVIFLAWGRGFIPRLRTWHASRAGLLGGYLLVALGPLIAVFTLLARLPAWAALLAVLPMMAAHFIGDRIVRFPGLLDRRKALLSDWAWLSRRRHEESYSAEQVAELRSRVAGLERYREPATDEFITITQAEYEDWFDGRIVKESIKADRSKRLRQLADAIWGPPTG